jgi:hypothetical protein
MSWSDLVLGGVDIPRIMTLDSMNYCNNPFFHNGDTSEWSGLYNMQSEINSDAYSMYMGKIFYQGVSAIYSYIGINTSQTVKKRKFIFSARIKSKFQYQIACVTDENSSPEIQSVIVIQASENVQRFVFICEIPDNIIGNGNEIGFRVYGSIGSQAELYIDQIFFSEIYQILDFPQPNKSYLRFIRTVTGNSELWSGKTQDINKRWKPYFHAEYSFMNPENELKRQIISEADLLFCIPHKDSSWGFVGKWDGDYDRRYSFDKFIGHTGVIPIIGAEYIMNSPTYKTDGGLIYIEDDLVIYT